MVISIDYRWAYDPAVSPRILKSTQIIGFTNFVLRSSQQHENASTINHVPIGVQGNYSDGKRGAFLCRGVGVRLN